MPETAQRVCDLYRQALLDELPDAVSGVYLHGSVALGDFQEGRSDIDFVTVVNRTLSDQDAAKLKRIHAKVMKSFRTPPMEGVYLLPDQLGRSRDELPPVPGYHDGRLPMGHFAINPVTWYELRQHGITLHGQEIASLDFDGSFEQLRDYSRDNIDSYWHLWVDAITKFPIRSLYALFSRDAVAWGVLGVTRLYHVIKEGDVVSKSGAGEYALQHFPQWQRIVNEALRARRGAEGSEYRNPWARKRDLIGYMSFIIDECHKAR